jgi:hypothetical protein
VQPNDWRFTVVDLFVGTARSPNSAITFLNYFAALGKHGVHDGAVTVERQGYRSGPSPWDWATSERPLCSVAIADGALEDSPAELHVEFANAFVGGGVMTGDFAMEARELAPRRPSHRGLPGMSACDRPLPPSGVWQELLFLVKPELMLAMALENRMVDTEAVCVAGALQYSLTSGFGSSFEFAGDYDGRRGGPPPRVCAIDAVRGGGPAMTEPALLRDMNKARVAFSGAREVATGHWGVRRLWQQPRPHVLEAVARRLRGRGEQAALPRLRSQAVAQRRAAVTKAAPPHSGTAVGILAGAHE